MNWTNLSLKSFLALTVLCCFFISFWSCKPAEVVKKVEEEKLPFTIKIIQDSQTLKAKNGIIEMKQMPFKFDFGMYETKTVYMAVSQERFYFDTPDDRDIFKYEDVNDPYSFKFAPTKCMVEESFNTSQTIFFADPLRVNCLFYDENLDWHRFDKGLTVRESDQAIFATKTVKEFHNVASGSVPLETLKGDIYVIAACGEKIDAGDNLRLTEVHRQKFILRFK